MVKLNRTDRVYKLRGVIFPTASYEGLFACLPRLNLLSSLNGGPCEHGECFGYCGLLTREQTSFVLWRDRAAWRCWMWCNLWEFGVLSRVYCEACSWLGIGKSCGRRSSRVLNRPGLLFGGSVQNAAGALLTLSPVCLLGVGRSVQRGSVRWYLRGCGRRSRHLLFRAEGRLDRSVLQSSMTYTILMPSGNEWARRERVVSIGRTRSSKAGKLINALGA
ncbi:hypothetical protein TSMEX_002307 [Taenia solium]|eukprot:TsM_000143800 transcript=TsM_000143800 gene=TsM_000143800